MTFMGNSFGICNLSILAVINFVLSGEFIARTSPWRRNKGPGLLAKNSSDNSHVIAVFFVRTGRILRLRSPERLLDVDGLLRSLSLTFLYGYPRAGTVWYANRCETVKISRLEKYDLFLWYDIFSSLPPARPPNSDAESITLEHHPYLKRLLN